MQRRAPGSAPASAKGGGERRKKDFSSPKKRLMLRREKGNRVGGEENRVFRGKERGRMYFNITSGERDDRRV